jgi:hypothetical protein
MGSVEGEAKDVATLAAHFSAAEWTGSIALDDPYQNGASSADGYPAHMD